VGNIISGLGIAMNLIGCGYWIWYGFAFEKNRFAVIRSRSPWHLLGNLTVIGILIFAAGRVLVAMRP
jgi:hypothetical protein